MIAPATRLRAGAGLGLTLWLVAGCAVPWVDKRAGLDTGRPAERSIPAARLGKPVTEEEQAEVAGDPEASVLALLAVGRAREVRVGLDGFRQALLENNLQLRVARLGPEMAATRVGAEFGRLDATLRASVSAVQELEDASSNNRPTEALESQYTGGEAGLSLPLATGGSIDLAADVYSYETVYLDGERRIDPSEVAYPTNLSATVTLPLLEGAGYDANLGPIAVAAIDERISVVDLRNLLTNLLSSSEQVYWQLVRAWRALEIQSTMLDLAIQTVGDIEALASGGVLPAFEQDRARFTVSQRRAAVLRADFELRRAMRAVKVLMNRPDVPLDAAVVVRPSSEVDTRGLILDRTRLAEVALQNRSELMRADLALRRDEVRLAMARRALLPRLDLQGSIGGLGIEENANRSIAGLLDGEFPPSWSVGLSFEVPLGNRRARNDLQAAQIARSRTEVQSRELQLEILQEVYDAVDRIESVWGEVAAYRRGEHEAFRNLEGVRELLRMGSSSALEVSLAIGDLSDARLALLDAEVRYQVALIQLAEATGTALGRQAVEVLPPRPGQSDGPGSRVSPGIGTGNR